MQNIRSLRGCFFVKMKQGESVGKRAPRRKGEEDVDFLKLFLQEKGEYAIISLGFPAAAKSRIKGFRENKNEY